MERTCIFSIFDETETQSTPPPKLVRRKRSCGGAGNRKQGTGYQNVLSFIKKYNNNPI